MPVNILRSNRFSVALIVGNNQFYRVEDSANPRGSLLEVLADGMLEQTDINHTLHFGVTNLVDKCADCLSGVSATAQTADCRHARVVPTTHKSLFDELQHLAFRHHGVGDIQAVELILVRTVVALHKLVEKIVVQRTVNDKLKGTNRMSNALEIVALSVCKVVHRIYIPLTPCAVVRVGSDDTIHDRVAEMHIRVRHINLGTQHHLAVLYLACLHSLE